MMYRQNQSAESREVLVTEPGSQTHSSVLWHPHLIFVAPGIVGPPDFESDGKLAARFGDKNSFHRMGNFGPGDNHDFFGNAFIDQNAIALAHSSAVLSSTPQLHGAKLPLPISRGKSVFRGGEH
jgi:hypothetical protein